MNAPVNPFLADRNLPLERRASTTRACAPISENVVANRVDHSARAAKLKARGVHVRRHTFCSHLAMRGAPGRAIQELAGHADVRTTQRYMHLSPAALSEAIRLLDSPVTPPSRGDILETAGGQSTKSLQ